MADVSMFKYGGVGEYCFLAYTIQVMFNKVTSIFMLNVGNQIWWGVHPKRACRKCEEWALLLLQSHYKLNNGIKTSYPEGKEQLLST